MNREARRELRKRLFFTTEDVARLFGITENSAQVFCSRQVAHGAFLRLKRNFYILEERLSRLEQTELFVLANYLQVPSYLSCTTALAYHGVTTQVPRGWLESICLKRSARYQAEGITFAYFKFRDDRYFGFEKDGAFFMAEKEKAFLDACHLCAHSRYALDASALDLERLDRERMAAMMSAFPERTQNTAKRLCGI